MNAAPAAETPPSSWPGEYMDGLSAVVHPVIIEDCTESLVIRHRDTGQELTRWAVRGTRLDALADGEAFHIQHHDHEAALLTTHARELAEALGRRVVQRAAVPGGAHRWRYAATTIAAIAAIVTLGYSALPFVSRVVARRVPLEYEHQLGAGTERFLEKNYCTDENAHRSLRLLIQRLHQDGVLPRQVRVLNLGLPNAFALPGGTVVLTRGLLEEAKGPDEIAGILAHELSHVQQRHVMIHVIRSSILAAVWATTVGDFTGLMVVDPSTAFQIANLRFSRADEASADEQAFAILEGAGISSGALADFFARLQHKYGDTPEWISTHPGSEQRAKAAAVHARNDTEPALDGASWAALKNACAGAPRAAVSLKSLF